jgi:high-affinity iron transporter
MAKNLFSVPIFFIVFRETLEAAIIISVLLGLAEQIVHEDPIGVTQAITDGSSPPIAVADEDHTNRARRLRRKLRIQVDILCNILCDVFDTSQIFLGAGLGLLLAVTIGAACVGIYDTVH